jgi:ABC-2 type transport system permease protein
MRLIRVELGRFFARRLTRFAAAGVLLILAVVLFGVQQQAYDSVPSRVQERTLEQVRQCRSQQANARQHDPSADFRCDEMAAQMQAGGQEVPSFASLAQVHGQNVAVLFAFVGFLIGATFLAAEFASGSIGNWLTFEPRRRRVYASKLAAAAIGSVPIPAIGLGLLIGGVYAVTTKYGVTGAVSADQRTDLLWLVLRVVVISSAATVAGAVLGLLLRNTAASLGVLVGYGILVEGIFPGLIQRLVPDPRPWLVQSNFQAWVGHDLKYAVDDCSRTGPETACESVERVITFGHSSIYFAILLVPAVALGAWVFNRRDVS